MIVIYGLALLNLLMLFGINKSLFRKQVLSWGIGLIIFYLSQKIITKNLFRKTKAIYLISVGLLIIPLIFGNIIGGSTRWINLGILSLQPSEISKPLLIGILSFLLAKTETKTFQKFISYLGLILIPGFLILIQPDLGSAGVVLISLLFLLFTKTAKIKWWLPIIIIGITLIFFGRKKILKPYQTSRITCFLNPYQDPQGEGYNIIQSQIALGSGGFWGKGFGSGRQTQLLFLPEQHNDFIFSAIGEEFGFVGIFFVIGLYAYLFHHLINKINQSDNEFTRIFRTGIFFFLFFQTSLNIAMNLQLFPIVGLPLPMLSYGGSSLISTLFSLGLF